MFRPIATVGAPVFLALLIRRARQRSLLIKEKGSTVESARKQGSVGKNL